MLIRTDYNDPHGQGELNLAYHYEMIADHGRVSVFQDAIRQVCKDKIVLESGTGTGILSILAAKAGARMVYACDLDSKIFAFARRNVKDAKLEHKIKLIHKNTTEVTTQDLEGHRAEVIIAENLSTWLVTEPQIHVLNHINNSLAAPNAVRIPSVIHNHFELSSAKYRFYDAVTMRSHYFQFSGIRSPLILSEPTPTLMFDMNRISPTEFDVTIDVKASRSGLLNSLRLTSPITVHDNIGFSSSDSLMPPVVTPLKQDLQVARGDMIRVHIQFRTQTSWPQFLCEAEHVPS